MWMYQLAERIKMLYLFIFACDVLLSGVEELAFAEDLNGEDSPAGVATVDQLCHHYKRWKRSGVSQEALQQALNLQPK